MITTWLSALLLAVIMLFSTHGLRAAADNNFTENEMEKLREGVGIVEHLGESVDLNLEFKNEKGETLPLSTYFQSGKPVLMAMIYFNCPSLCNFQLNGVTETLKELEWTTGEKFEFVVVSIEPKETPEMAIKKKKAYLDLYSREAGAKGWHFLTGKAENITKLAKQVGFQYKWVESRKEYAHTAASYVITPKGQISRYLYGIAFTAKTLRLSLVEASEGKIGTAVDRFLLYCFRYDPEKRGYAFYAFNIMRAGAGVAVVLIAIFLIPFWIRQRKQQLKEKA